MEKSGGTHQTPTAAGPIKKVDMRDRRTRVFAVEAFSLGYLGLRTLLADNHDMQICGVASNLTAALTAVRDARPDIVLMDSSLDNTATGLRAIAAEHPGIGIIAFVHANSQAKAYLHAARTHGVRGLLPRSAPPSRITTTIRAVKAGGEIIDRHLAALMSHGPAHAGATRLTDRQAAILSQIATGRSNAQIATSLGVSVETVRTHVKAILLRLGARDRAHAVARGFELDILSGTTDHPPRPLSLVHR